MALTNNLSSIRGIHVSPGVYAQESILEYAVKSLGITTLGAVGETVKGPAFQPMHIENWNDFMSMFGGTDTSRFKGNKYPKYELPYIAKQFLSESKQLEVVRVLGLSGYNAGPAWLITADGKGSLANKKVPVAIVRSRGYYEKYPSGNDDKCSACELNEYDKLLYYVGQGNGKGFGTDVCSGRTWDGSKLGIGEYTDLTATNNCTGTTTGTTSEGFGVSTVNYGRFTLSGTAFTATTDTTGVSFSYPVSLNPDDKDYILKVLGTNPDDGDAFIYVETIFDSALARAISEDKVSAITSSLTFFTPKPDAEMVKYAPVDDLMDKPESALTRVSLGKRYLATSTGYTYHTVESGQITTTANTVVGGIYTVSHITNNGKRIYVYIQSLDDNGQAEVLDKGKKVVVNAADGLYYTETSNSAVTYVSLDINNYKSAYRYASTPWIVSNLLGDANNLKVERMFRFHTISDGAASNYEVKVSIENVRTDEKVFDVMVHAFNDTDDNPVILEKFTKCNMIPGSSSYIAYKIGSYDGSYESKSKYITVEVNESTIAQNASPAGFLGYTTINFKGVDMFGNSGNTAINKCPVAYNTTYDVDIKNRKQYFGLSSRVGVDVDLFSFKGAISYIDDQNMMTPGFHLDSRLKKFDTGNTGVATIDGWDFNYVGMDNISNTLVEIPVIDTEENMKGCIYENVNLRKFMVYFAGGFDGWDIYRDQRTNTDEFKMSNYLGSITKKGGKGYNFDRIENPEALGLNENGITSDFYAYLSAIRQFANPEAVDINVFVTPGIDLINNKELSNNAIEMIEEERADSIYVATTPDKPSGADDYVDEMYSAQDVVDLLEDTEIDSNYTCTYYPWVKYFDQDNAQYIYLPVTKDVVTNMAMTDNRTYPWFAPAGINRGDVNCVKAHVVTKIADEDALYDGRINPVKTFAQDGVKIWGQKTLQTAENQLNRIATRRLLLRMRKLISIACRQLVFEPNTPTAKQQFMSIVTPIMDNIRSNRGISDYRIEVLDSAESRERYELPARIYFKAYNQIEYILLDFVLTPEGISFSDI